MATLYSRIEGQDVSGFMEKVRGHVTSNERRIEVKIELWQQTLLLPNTTTAWLVRDSDSGLFYCSACNAHAMAVQVPQGMLPQTGQHARQRFNDTCSQAGGVGSG